MHFDILHLKIWQAIPEILIILYTQETFYYFRKMLLANFPLFGLLPEICFKILTVKWLISSILLYSADGFTVSKTFKQTKTLDIKTRCKISDNFKMLPKSYRSITMSHHTVLYLLNFKTGKESGCIFPFYSYFTWTRWVLIHCVRKSWRKIYPK